jgi:hypothetical protein
LLVNFVNSEDSEYDGRAAVWLDWEKGKDQRQGTLPLHIQSAVSSSWGVMRSGMAGRQGRNQPLGKDDAGVKQGRVCKGHGPDNPANPFYLGGGFIDFQEKAESCVLGQYLPGGKANAVLAEINGPSVILPHAGKVIAAGDFGKTENMATGDTNGAPAVDWWRIDLPGCMVKSGQQLIVTATGMMAGKAKRNNMLFYRKKKANLNQLTGVAGTVPMGAVCFLQPVCFP